MPRASKTGVKGLYKANGRYHVDLRYEDTATAITKRHVEHLPRGLSLAAAKERARQLLNHAYAGTLLTSDVHQPDRDRALQARARGGGRQASHDQPRRRDV